MAYYKAFMVYPTSLYVMFYGVYNVLNAGPSGRAV